MRPIKSILPAHLIAKPKVPQAMRESFQFTRHATHRKSEVHPSLRRLKASGAIVNANLALR